MGRVSIELDGFDLEKLIRIFYSFYYEGNFN